MAALSVLVAGLDLATKEFAERRLGDPVALVPGLTLDLGYNSGMAFGALRGLPAWVLVVVVAAVIAVSAVAWWRGLLPVPLPALGLLLGGAVGNLVDRLDDGRVTDFIELPAWPAFNFADMAITAAIVLIVWWSWREGSEPRRAVG